MKQLLTVFFFCCVASSSVFAAIISVNNNPNTSADYSSFQAAVDAASSGDVIMVYGSGISYGIDTIDKPLVIIGPGYLLSANPNTQVNPTSAKFEGLLISSGASGSIITGLEITGTTVFNAAIKIEQTSNIIISRNNMTTGTLDHEPLQLHYSSNIQILQNYINNNYAQYVHDAIVLWHSSGIIIKNNMIEAKYKCIEINNTSSALFENNIIRARYGGSVTSYNLLDVDNSIFKNNILINTYSISGSNYSAQNNICTHSIFGTSGGNQANVALSTIFVSAAGSSPDGKWQLSASSPAIGAGVGGVDCGIFGGTEPYVLSGIPFVPNIYEINMPSSGTSSGGINVNIKVRANQ